MAVGLQVCCDRKDFFNWFLHWYISCIEVSSFSLIFLSNIHVYTKYFVLPFSMDVVSTLTQPHNNIWCIIYEKQHINDSDCTLFIKIHISEGVLWRVFCIFVTKLTVYDATLQNQGLLYAALLPRFLVNFTASGRPFSNMVSDWLAAVLQANQKMC